MIVSEIFFNFIETKPYCQYTTQHIYISPVNCCQFLGLKNNVEIEITTFGVDSEYKVNVITLRSINIK